MTSPAPGIAEYILPNVRRVLAPNPGPMTHWGTNSYILGTGQVAIIDPGPDHPAHLAALLEATKGETVTHILVTHAHADHVHGLDDLRMIVINMRARLPVWADAPTRAALLDRFGYAFERPEGSMYPPILDMNEIDGDVTIEGAGGALTFTPFLVPHGGMDALGFRVNDVAYLPDVASLPDDIWPHLNNLECWIVDALRREPHPTHSHLAQTLDWIDRVSPRTGVLTNMHNDLDYDTVAAETPDHIQPAFDGLTLSYPLP